MNAQESPITGKAPHILKKNANSPIIIHNAKNGDVMPSVFMINIADVMTKVMYEAVEIKTMNWGLSLKNDTVQSIIVNVATAAAGRPMMNGELIWGLPVALPQTKAPTINSATKKRDPQKRRCHDGFWLTGLMVAPYLLHLFI